MANNLGQPTVGAADNQTDKRANALAQDFARDLIFLRSRRDKRVKRLSKKETLHVTTAGATVSEIYETIRNASENADESLLLQHAIRRFLRRTFLVNNLTNVAEDLVTDLTLARYLRNDSIALETLAKINRLTTEFAQLRLRLLKKFSHETADRWTLEPLSAQIEIELRGETDVAAVIDLAKAYFARAIDTEQLLHTEQPRDYDITLFIAVAKIIVKQDEPMIRQNLLERYEISRQHAVSFAEFNYQLDQIFASDTLAKISHVVDRHGAVFRIITETVAGDKKITEHVLNEKQFLGPFDAAISNTYAAVRRNVNRGIVRSVVFLIITKFVIGIAAEVPFDLLINHHVVWRALIINLLLPPLYMIALRFTLLMPNLRNRRALTRQVSRILYAPVPTKSSLGASPMRRFSSVYNFIYSLFVVAIFVGVTWLLITFASFEWLHLLIFFVFISTASFLGFRLSRQIRNIEIGAESQTSLTLLRDLIYMPFVAVGRRISEAYSRVNIVSRLLDTLVELPLKTVLGFLRRWGNFLSAKRDEF